LVLLHLVSGRDVVAAGHQAAGAVDRLRPRRGGPHEHRRQRGEDHRARSAHSSLLRPSRFPVREGMAARRGATIPGRAYGVMVTVFVRMLLVSMNSARSEAGLAGSAVRVAVISDPDTPLTVM